MKICVHFIVLYIKLSIIFNAEVERILPFTRIKIVNQDIYFTLNNNKSNWYKLITINSIGSDAIVNFSLQNFGQNKCDYDIECYKYNIVVNFDKIFSMINKTPMLKKVNLEFEVNKLRNRIETECTVEKFKLNKDEVKENLNKSKNSTHFIFSKLFEDSIFFKGNNKLNKIFKSIEGQNVAIPDNNLNNELIEIKNEINKLKMHEEKIEKDLIEDIKILNNNIKSEKSIIEKIWKREIIAGIVGSIIVFSGFVVYYLSRGLLKVSAPTKKSINYN